MGLLDEYLPVARLYMVSLVGTLVINSITWLSQRKKVHGVSARAKGLGEEIRQLRQQAEQLSSPDTFVQSSKLKRAANAKEKELESVWQELQGNHKSKGARNIKLMLMAALAIASWGVPVGEVPFSTTWATSFFRFPHSQAWCGQGCVAVIPWLAMVDRTTHALLQVAFPISHNNFLFGTKAQ